jgi:hypothetical protein
VERHQDREAVMGSPGALCPLFRMVTVGTPPPLVRARVQPLTLAQTLTLVLPFPRLLLLPSGPAAACILPPFHHSFVSVTPHLFPYPLESPSNPLPLPSTTPCVPWSSPLPLPHVQGTLTCRQQRPGHSCWPPLPSYPSLKPIPSPPRPTHTHIHITNLSPAARAQLPAAPPAPPPAAPALPPLGAPSSTPHSALLPLWTQNHDMGGDGMGGRSSNEWAF